MKVRIAIEQVVDVDEMLSNDIEFEIFGDPSMTDEDKVAYLIDRFAEDIDTLVKHDEVMDNISVEYLEG